MPQQSHRIQIAIVCVLSAIAGCGFNLTVSRPDLYPGIFSVSLAWLIHSFLAVFFGEAFLKMDTKQFRFARWEREGGVYEWVGIRAFRWILFCTRWNDALNRDIRLKSGRSDLDRLLRFLNYAEGTHTISGVITFVAAAAFTLSGHGTTGVWLAGVNVLLNIYPVMLQRWNRGRVFRAQRRLAMRSPIEPLLRPDAFPPQSNQMPANRLTHHP